MTADLPRVIRGAHVIDVTQGIDEVVDVVIQDGKILSIGSAPDDCEVIHLPGRFLSPGWVDIHVHVYGQLGFADPDSIGVYQGVTTYVEAGGPGIATMPEFMALMGGSTRTDLYSGCYISPMGITGIDHIEGQPRSIHDIPIAKWLDMVEEHPGVVRYLKFGAFSSYGTGPLKIGKGLAETLGLPIYVHIGEIFDQPGAESAYEIYRIATAGDIITHAYHGNDCGILDSERRVRSVVREAQDRGVLFDVGFGGFNFSWTVAEAAMAQGFKPDIISSDLQQYNVVGPVYSLANVMTVFLALGMPLRDIVERVTIAPSRALSLDGIAGTLKQGMPADITVFSIEEGPISLTDTGGRTRPYDKKIVPELTFKRGEKIVCDMLRCQDERNWILQIADELPPEAARLSGSQTEFLHALRAELEDVSWNEDLADEVDLTKCIELHEAFHRAGKKSDLPLKDKLEAAFSCFLSSSFKIQVGVLLQRVGRQMALGRLAEATAKNYAVVY